ncbi:MAG: PEP-CTERM sorting domain-containing protein, partial [Verrucomicrobiales bacterium]|nr:PEP-CTERM sorting domain-containing protein [Verrucomicrobiales bacterium]
AGNGLSDTLAFTNNAATLNFNAGATIALNFLNDYSPAEGDSWLFATGYNALGSVFDQDNIIVTGLAADTYAWALDHGALQLTMLSIPEPSSAVLLLLGGAILALTLRRRR